MSELNDPYVRIVEEARRRWPHAELLLSFDGQHWRATIAVAPLQSAQRWVTGTGPTQHLAVLAVMDGLGVPRREE